MAIEDETFYPPTGEDTKSQPRFKRVIENVDYTVPYRERCFKIWYEAGQPRIINKGFLPEDEYGRMPNRSTIRKWKNDPGGWVERAGKLNLAVSEEMDGQLITKRIEMFERHADAGANLADLGIEYLLEEGIDTANAAIKAIKEGTELERKSVGISELLKKFSTMKDSQIVARVQELLAADEGEELLDDENIVDAEFDETVVEETDEQD